MSAHDDELREALREPHEEARARANWEAIQRRRRGPTPRVPSSGGLWLGALGLGVAALVFFAFGLGRTPGPLVTADGTPASGVLEGEVVTLDDGSEIRLDAGARLEVLENTGDHVRFWLHEGAAHFDVVPHGPRRWAIEAGLVTVEVLGTAFTVARTAHEVRVAVERGSVLVRSPRARDGMQRLQAGESVTLPADETPEAEAEASVVAPPATTLAAVDVAPAPRARESATPTTRASAPEPSESAPVESAAPRTPRLRDVDALRAAGRTEEAAAMLQTIADDPSAGAERALAAFTRARLELDRLEQPAEAARAFAQAIALGLRAPLVEDARARRVEALARAGDGPGARAAAEEYRLHHPDGRWSAEVERWSASP